MANPSLSSNITLEFCPGNHCLNSQLSVSNINTFTMVANAAVTVTCNQQLQLYEPFYFRRLQQVYVSGITFIGCGMVLQYITNGTVERSSFLTGPHVVLGELLFLLRTLQCKSYNALFLTTA